MKVIDVFSDASCNRAFYCGAYIIGNTEPVGIQITNCETSCDAELLMSALGISEAAALHPGHPIVAHSDLDQVELMAKRQKTIGAVALAAALQTFGATVKPDGNSHYNHIRCHRAARAVAGRYDEMPGYSVHEFQPSQIYVDSIMDVLRNHPLGISQAEIGRQTDLQANTVVKILRFLERSSRARCERPASPIQACDLEQVRWLRGASFGTRLGDLLDEAGITA